MDPDQDLIDQFRSTFVNAVKFLYYMDGDSTQEAVISMCQDYDIFAANPLICYLLIGAFLVAGMICASFIGCCICYCSCCCCCKKHENEFQSSISQSSMTMRSNDQYQY